MKVIEFNKPAADTVEALEILDMVRKDVESGKLKAYIVVAIDDDHGLHGYSATTKKTTRLEMMGAMMALQWNYVEGAL